MMRIALCAAAVVLIAAGQAGAASHYVSTTGDNAASGTASAPWRTIGYAATRVSAGDTVSVLPGTYAENVRTTLPGQPNTPITFQSETRGAARIVPPADSAAAIAWELSGSYVHVDGFEIDGASHVSGTRWLRGVAVYGDHNTVRGNVVKSIGRAAACSESGYGIGTELGAEYVTIHGNSVLDIGPSGC